MTARPVFADHDHFWFETLRVLGHTAYGGADIGEVLTVAGAIESGNAGSWHQHWTAMGDRIFALAEASRLGGHQVSARDGFLRAASYFRIADFFLHGQPDDPRIRQSHRRSISSFTAFAALAHNPIERVEIPFEEGSLSGWFCRAHHGHGPRPLLLAHNGFDGAGEEMFFFGGYAAAERGFHVLLFDGPGQPSALNDRALHFRPEWETVVTPVLDHALDAYGEDVDPDRIGLLGVSLGGMLAPRAAAIEPRISAVACVDGIYDASSAISDLLGTDRAGLERLVADPASSETFLTAAAETNPMLAWIFDHGRYALGVNTRSDFVTEYLRYNLLGGIAERITCPILVCEAADDIFYTDTGTDERPTEPRRLAAHLHAPMTLTTFTSAEGAGSHSHGGAERLAMGRILDWLEVTLAAGRPSPSFRDQTR